MGEDLSRNQQKLNDQLNLWIKKMAIPQEFSFTIENEVVKINSSLIQLPSIYFKEDFKILVEKEYFFEILRNGEQFYISGNRK